MKPNIVRKALILLVLTGTFSVSSWAQQSPKAAAPQPAKTKLEIVSEGEMRLDGKITALLGTGIWQMDADSWTSPRGVTKEFDEAKAKGVEVAADAIIHPRGEEGKVALQDVKLGSRIAVIGKNAPDGTLKVREVILLEGYGAIKTVGQLVSNPVSMQLVEQSRAAREAGQLPKALTLINKAIETARGMNDLSGEALATQDKALLHSALEQPEEALAASQRLIAIGRTTGNPLILALGLQGAAGTLMRGGHLPEALELLKEADPVGATASPLVHLQVLSRLSLVYLMLGQKAEGVEVLKRIQPIEQSQGLDSDAGETLLSIAMLEADEKPDEARAALAEGQIRLDRAHNEQSKAALIGSSALLRYRLGQKDEALAGLAQAAQLYEAAGNATLAKSWAGMAKSLEGVGPDWQDFWRAINGLKPRNAKPETKETDDKPAEN